jgi:flagellar motility protein MotE (MotC chaperone)
MKKKSIILLAAVGMISFALTFGASFVLKKNKAAPAAVTTPPAAATAKKPAVPDVPRATSEDSQDSLLSESQLKTLIYDVRQKMQEYKDKEKDLEQEAGRIELARQTLQGDVDQLNQLREKLNLTLTSLQEKERSLRDSLIEIETIEKNNLVRIAATYDKMDSVQAGKILATMTANDQAQDAVKILYYMSERSAGKLLGEIGSASPEVAGKLILQLKKVKEQK